MRERERESRSKKLILIYANTLLVVIIVSKTRDQGLVMNKSVSLPLSLVEAVLDEADLMHASFSKALVTLVRTGIAQRRLERAREEKEQETKREREDLEALRRLKESRGAV